MMSRTRAFKADVCVFQMFYGLAEPLSYPTPLVLALER